MAGKDESVVMLHGILNYLFHMKRIERALKVEKDLVFIGWEK